jgi:hypothetical protein
LPVRSEKIDVVGTNVVLSQSDDRSLKTDFAVVVEDGLRNVSQLSDTNFGGELAFEASEDDLALRYLETVYGRR